MRWQTSRRVGAVVMAVALGGSYVAFRTVQAREGREAATAAAAAAGRAPTTSPSTRPTTRPSLLMAGSKFSAVGYKNPDPSDNSTSGGFKLSNDVSAEFAVASDICPALPDPAPPATAPSSGGRSWQP